MVTGPGVGEEGAGGSVWFLSTPRNNQTVQIKIKMEVWFCIWFNIKFPFDCNRLWTVKIEINFHYRDMYEVHVIALDKSTPFKVFRKSKDCEARFADIDW